MAGGRWSEGQGTFWGDLVGPNPTDRAKVGVKRSILVEAEGGPLSVVIAGANVPDFKLLEATIEAIVTERPEPTEQAPHEHLCLEKGYDKEPAREVLERQRYVPHIRRIGEEKKDDAGEKRYPARRWVVERTLGWLSKCRAILVPLREEGDELPGADQGGLHLAVVSAPASPIPFEIVCKTLLPCYPSFA